MLEMQEALMAFFAAVGLLATFWVATDLLLARRERTVRGTVLLPLSGGAEEMEYAVEKAGRLQRQLHCDGPVLLVDCGMDAESLRRAALLVRDRAGVKLVYPEEIEEQLY